MKINTFIFSSSTESTSLKHFEYILIVDVLYISNVLYVLIYFNLCEFSEINIY